MTLSDLDMWTYFSVGQEAFMKNADLVIYDSQALFGGKLNDYLKSLHETKANLSLEFSDEDFFLCKKAALNFSRLIRLL